MDISNTCKDILIQKLKKLQWTIHYVPIQPLLPQMTSDAKLAVFKEEFSGSAGWSGHAPPANKGNLI
jgi:hypothetical protein